MADTPTCKTVFQQACESMNQSEATPRPYPWHEHGAFDDIEAARWKIARARDALAGIAAMLEPAHVSHDGQMNMANRSDASAVLAFFAEAMIEPLDVLDKTTHRLRTELQKAHQCP